MRVSGFEHIFITQQTSILKFQKSIAVLHKFPSNSTINMNAIDVLSKDHRDLLDVIDSLRAQGCDNYVGLPEIAVCGEQKAGKSSVLEAISGLQFPTKDVLCTCFATELVLRRDTLRTTRVSIRPGGDRSDQEREDLKKWQPKSDIEKDGLDAVIEEAKEIMAIPHPKKFYDDVLHIESTGPEQPHLTMIDLPGVFQASNEHQSDEDAEVVRTMVKDYMARPRCIILPVLSAKGEYVNQPIMTMAREADPGRVRTLGIITKPDTVDVGSGSESNWLRTAQNLDVKLDLGWHVLRNRSFEEQGSSISERNAQEHAFFSKGVWASLPSRDWGAKSLKSKLSAALKHKIIEQLPSLRSDVEARIKQCTEGLSRLGPVRATPSQQSDYLTQVSESYTSLMTQAVAGTYTDQFFGSRGRLDISKSYPRRLRAVVQSHLAEFRDDMLRRGQANHIINTDEEEASDDAEVIESERITRSEYVQQVTDRLKFSKGRELPGLFNPLIVGDLFAEQCEPWRDIALQAVERIVDSVEQTMRLLIAHVAADHVADKVIEVVLSSAEQLRQALDEKVEELLPSPEQHPITYNRQLTDLVDKARDTRRRREIQRAIDNTFGVDLSNPKAKISCNPSQLLEPMMRISPYSMENSGSSLAVDYMQAYYKIALDRFVDDMSTLAIEDCLISKLARLFRPTTIRNMDPEEISRLAGESAESTIDRDRLVQQFDTLREGLPILRSFQSRRQTQDIILPPSSVLGLSESLHEPSPGTFLFRQ
ncbi:hypothetical protein CC79DRAFT_1269593 [Sarocladium strictum]